ncbi:Arc family DNA-binding protein [Devosia sp.]|uniref:Arc family DNA-binding protein n=1 Tax=Devosia sp. TaxID=1871048 RepID=UPI0027323CBF|nr:Arc family DNA-binding protein [Devosia sp.]MDP2779849.1 Arc family DNA-binding protein [Devosia sp.]
MADDERKLTANITPFGLRMQPDLKAQVEASARKNSRSMNSEIVYRLGTWDDLAEQVDICHAKIDEMVRIPNDVRNALEHQAILANGTLEDEVKWRLEASLTSLLVADGSTNDPESYVDFIDEKLDEVSSAVQRLKRMIAERK